MSINEAVDRFLSCYKIGVANPIINRSDAEAIALRLNQRLPVGERAIVRPLDNFWFEAEIVVQPVNE